MSIEKHIEQAVRRAAKRDKKRQSGMKVTGKAIFIIAKAIHQPTHKLTNKHK